MIYPERKMCINYMLKLLLTVIWLIPVSAASQTPAVTATSSQLNLQPNNTLTITLSVDTAVDAYYFGLEAIFDPNVFEFVSVDATGLMSNGIKVADLLNEGRAGASVSRTSPLGAANSGDMLILTFRIIQEAPVGTSQLSFENVELNDSNGASIEISEPEPVAINVEEAISDLRLLISEDNNITEGEELEVAGSVYVNDVTVDENTESERITMWVGINDVDSNPSEWAETAWKEMDFDDVQNAYHAYKANVGFGLQPGSYYIALRGQLDSDSYVYGGRSSTGGGIWDGIDNANSGLTISEQSYFRHVLAGWDFDDETLIASKSVSANDDITMQLVGADNDGFSSNGASGMAANSDGWQFTEGDQKYWLTELSTEGFQNITVSSKQYSTGAGPRDFELEGSLDGVNWEVVSTDTIRLASDWSSGVIDALDLPERYDDQQNVYLRWIRRGDVRVDGDDPISSGSNRMDDVYVRGENLNAQDLLVWPGDCDDNGIVDELDVLEIGQYWLAEGPTPVYNSTGWAQRQVESWIPEAAAYADANGDGIVNHQDLQPLGLHFGNDHTSSKQSANQLKPLSELVLPALDAGESIIVAVKTVEPVALTGLSVRFRLSGVNASAWDLKNMSYADWGKSWEEDNKLLGFQRRANGSKRASGTWVYKGEGTPATTDSLAVFEIEATHSWRQQANLLLERVVVAENGSRTDVESAVLVSDQKLSDENPLIPQSLRLDQNYPNPFNPSTVISYALPKEAEISIVLYDMLGRKVATIFEGIQQAGTYSYQYQPVSLSSGIYIYQLKTENRIINRKFTYIK